MITQVNAKKESGLNDLFKDYVPQQLEEIKKITPESSPIVEKVVKLYDEIANRTGFYHNPHTSFASVNVNALYMRLSREPHVLTPTDINSFIQIAIHLPIHEQNSKAASSMLGRFVSWYINQAYDEGYRYFPLQFTAATFPIQCLGSNVKGTLERPIHLFLDGDITGTLGDGSAHVMYTINGTVSHFLAGGKWYNPEPKSNLYILHGEPKGYIDLNTFNSVFGFPKECVFKTSDARWVPLLYNLTPPENIVYAIDHAGQEIMIRRYSDPTQKRKGR